MMESSAKGIEQAIGVIVEDGAGVGYKLNVEELREGQRSSNQDKCRETSGLRLQMKRWSPRKTTSQLLGIKEQAAVDYKRSNGARRKPQANWLG